jgi:hypothetical protein
MRLKDITIIVAVASLLLSSGCIGQDEKVVDSDGDGWGDEQELSAGTDPANKDTDGDGYWDPKDENPLDPDIPVLRETPTPVDAVVPTPPVAPTSAPAPTPVFEITSPADGDRVAHLITVKGHGGEPGAKVRIRVCNEEEGDKLQSGVGYPDENGNWEVDSVGLWPSEGYTSGESATIYALLTVHAPGVTTIYQSNNVTVTRS